MHIGPSSLYSTAGVDIYEAPQRLFRCCLPQPCYISMQIYTYISMQIHRHISKLVIHNDISNLLLGTAGVDIYGIVDESTRE